MAPGAEMTRGLALEVFAALEGKVPDVSLNAHHFGSVNRPITYYVTIETVKMSGLQIAVALQVAEEHDLDCTFTSERGRNELMISAIGEL